MESNNIQNSNLDHLRDDAELLLSVASLAANEFDSQGPTSFWGCKKEISSFPRLPLISSTSPLDGPSPTKYIMKPRLASLEDLAPKADASSGTGSSSEDSSSAASSSSSAEGDHRTSPTADCFDWSRARSVSLDLSTDLSHNHHLTIPESPKPRKNLGMVNIVSPMNSPTSVRLAPIRKLGLQAKKAKRESLSSGEGKQRQIKAIVPEGKPIKKILRSRFSWKNYPELEAFLIGKLQSINVYRRNLF